MQNFWRLAQERLKQLPGVKSVTMMDGLPPLRPENDNDTGIEGFVRVPNGPVENVAYDQITGDRFFETLGARLIEGRFLEARDGTKSTPGVVVNATMARTFWPHQSAIGRRVRIDSDQGTWIPVVGVVADMKNGGLEKPPGTELFIPYELLPDVHGLDSPNVVVTASVDPLSLTAGVRRVIASIDPSLPIAKLRTMDDVMAAASSRPRFLTLVLGMFSVLALALAAVGIYGVMSFSVEQRTTEFGIKMVLGAERRKLLHDVIGEGLLMGIIGIAVGIAGALVLTRSLEGLFFGIPQADLPSFALTAAILMTATIAACLFPAIRAVRIEPVTAVRYE